MKINLIQKENANLKNTEVNIEVQYKDKNSEIQSFIDYIYNYELGYTKKVVVTDEYELVEIKYKDIIKFYSDKKYNYCKTKIKSYRVKSKLYELEKVDTDFIRISKNCIVNIQHIEKFDINETGKIIIKLDDNTEEYVSRRKIKDVMEYLDERRI